MSEPAPRPAIRSPHHLIADVAQVLLRHNGAALCVRRKPRSGSASGQLAVLGGYLYADESLDHAARRRAEEVTGVRFDAEGQEFCGLLHRHEPGGTDRITAVFVSQTWTGEPHTGEPHAGEPGAGEPDAQDGLFWVSIERPPADCHPHTAHIFHLLTHGPSYRALNWPAQGGSLV